MCRAQAQQPLRGFVWVLLSQRSDSKSGELVYIYNRTRLARTPSGWKKIVPFIRLCVLSEFTLHRDTFSLQISLKKIVHTKPKHVLSMY